MIVAQLISLFRRASIPIHGVSIGKPDDRSTWRIERADKAFTAYLALPETQAFLKVHTDLKEAVFLDEIDSDPDFDPRGEVEDHLEIAYKQAYKDTHSRP